MLEGNTFSVNLFLLLFILFFAIAGFDLSSELAKEKNEINFVLDTFEDGCNIPQLEPKGLDEINRPLEAAIPITESYLWHEAGESTNDDRGPPAV